MSRSGWRDIASRSTRCESSSRRALIWTTNMSVVLRVLSGWPEVVASAKDTRIHLASARDRNHSVEVAAKSSAS